MVSFPWTAFRRFDWNAGRTVLDPAPRWFTRTTVVSDDLVIDTRTGPVVVSGDDPRAQEISRALAAGEPVGDLLTGLGVGWALVARGTPGPVPDLPGWDLVVEGEGLALYAAPEGSVAEVVPESRLIAGVDLAVLAGLVVAAGILLIRRVRVRRPRGLVP